jgi:DNA polymerase I-like protein with 3'-5' exonuclease and polymerase domains
MATLPPIPDWISLEHQVAQLLQQQEEHGWAFNERAAWELTQTLQKELEEASKVLRDRHPFVKSEEKTPKRNNKTQGYVEGCTFTRIKELNPTSRDHIAWVLKTFYNWIPTSFTNTQKPIIDETILTEIGTDISMMFLKCLTLTKSLGMLTEGVNAWLRLERNGRIHHHCSVATITHRCAHRKPNLAQVPSDERFRQLFIPTKGFTMVGADLSGIELRMLAHYLARYDGGRYAKLLLEDDIHQVNADAIGITRKQVKTVTYAFLYGAGDQKIGLSFDEHLTEKGAKAKGREIRDAYVSAIPGLDKLLEAVKEASKRGFVKSIDGRKISVDSQHKALNMLLQSSAGVIAKRWMLLNHTTMRKLGLCAHQLAFVHDELQFEVHPTHAKDLCSSLVYSATEAGEYYNLRIRIDAEAAQGNNWADTH